MTMPDRMPNTMPADAMMLSVRDAARVLHTSPEAIRKRLDRGTLQGAKRGRQWVVYVSVSDIPADAEQDAGADAVAYDNTTPRDTPPDAQPDALVTALQDEITFLRGELAGRTEEIRRRDHIIAGLVESMRALPAGEHPQIMPQDANAGPVRDDSPLEAPSIMDRLRRLMGR